MNRHAGNGQYPRSLTDQERELLDFVLPADRVGYRVYRESIAHMVVLGEGRRGAGNLLLGPPGGRPDRDSPLPPVVALGVVETSGDELTISVRETTNDQIDVEFVMQHSNGIPRVLSERRRYTYSAWMPGELSPRVEKLVREIVVSDAIVLAVAGEEQRMWVHDRGSGMNILLPITSFYSELMTREKIRDPEIALKPSRFYGELHGYTDDSLCEAFRSYNRQYPKVRLEYREEPERSISFGRRIRRALGMEKTDG